MKQDSTDSPTPEPRPSRSAGKGRRALLWFGFALLAFAILPNPTQAAPCQEIPAGKYFWIRLNDPVASYSTKPGTIVRASLIQSPECDQLPVFPAGTQVIGQVTAVRKVGWGLIHDTAKIEIVFDRMVTVDGTELPIASQVVEVDNARETVRNGVIHGIRATNTPQGRITSRLIHMPTLNPYTDMGLVVYRAFTVLPEPEIYLPPGTDLRLRLNVALYVGDQPDLARPTTAMDEYERGDIEMLLGNSSIRTTTHGGKDADLVNLAFVGSKQQVQNAFMAAGWVHADPNSKKAFFKQFGAFLTFSNYPNMPISRQYLDGQLQDLTWQKSFDSYGKRAHLRMWEQPETINGEDAWLGAYTRETSAALSIKYHKFIHHIDRNLDEGVAMMIRDLTLAGCVEAVQEFPRQDVPHLMTNSTGDEMRTDGDLMVVHLKSCNPSETVYAKKAPLIPMRPSSRLKRYFRTQVLVYKSDVVRGNIIYGAFDLTRMSIRSLRHRHPEDADDEDIPMSPVTVLPQLGGGGE